MNIRLRILRHKHWPDFSHAYFVWMFYLVPPFFEKMGERKHKEESEELCEYLNSPQENSFDIVLERYDEKGHCVYPPIFSL